MGSKLTNRIMEKYYKTEDHPFLIFENRISSRIRNDYTIVDAGCGSKAPLLVKFIGKAQKLVGVDLVKFDPSVQHDSLCLLNNDLSRTELADSSVDLVISRSVLEHIGDVESVYREIHRILRPGGTFLFLVPNLWDYVSMISYLTPNRFHKAIVSRLSGRAEENVFPTFYKSNTGTSIKRLASHTGFEVNGVSYYGQYPYMLKFNSILFSIGVMYDKLVSRCNSLKYLRGWMLAELMKPDLPA